MTIGKQIATPLAVCVAASWFMVAGSQAEATTRPVGEVAPPTLGCAYRIAHVRKGGYLNIRSGPGLHHRPTGKLRAAGGRIAVAVGAAPAPARHRQQRALHRRSLGSCSQRETAAEPFTAEAAR